MSQVEGAIRRGVRLVAPIAAALTLCAVTGVAFAALAKPTSVTTHQTKRGKVLAATNGHSLYLFTDDSSARSNCSYTCAKTWKPLLTSGRPIAESGSGVNTNLLGTTRRTDGTLQVTYKGHPLYTFAQDHSAGQINGEGVNAFRGRWYVVSTTGNAVKPKSGGGGRVCHPVCQSY